jgi:histidinol-phosphate aminotransferase
MQNLIDRTIRADVCAQHAYAVPDASGMTKLEAMENPYTLPPALRAELGQHLAQVALNRYPVPSYRSLKDALCREFGVPHGYDVVLGNGSDELITMLMQACARPGQSGNVVLAALPTFVMYALSAQLANMQFVGVDLQAVSTPHGPDFVLDLPAMLVAIEQHQPALIFLSYPNNPTGTLFAASEIEQIIKAAPGIVVVDEAYQPFAGASFMARLPEFENLVLLRTVSKLGLAGIRLGYMSAHPALLAQVDKVRPPYNINVLTEATAGFLLQHGAVFAAQAAALREARGELAQGLRACGLEVFPSAANFLLVRFQNGDLVFQNLLNHKILVKNVGKGHALLHNCLRITVSTPDENRLLLQAIRQSLP